MRRLIAALLCASAIPAAVAGFRSVGTITDARVPEASGLAPSRAHPGLLWVENDSGNPADVFLIEPSGKVRATLHVDGVPNIDWEDFASFDLRGRHYLLLADAGDNRANRDTVALHVLAEPAVIADTHERPAWSIAFRWPGGPRDCEAVAVDVRTDSILLISKRLVPAQLYRLPLHPRTHGVLTAQYLGTLVGIRQPSASDIASNPIQGRYFAQVTAASMAPDANSLAVLTYRRLYLYRRRHGENWPQAVSRAPKPLSFGWLLQAEALAFRLDGKGLYVTGEHLPAPIVQVNVPSNP